MEKIIYSVMAKKSSADMVGVYIRCTQYTHKFDIDTKIRVFTDEWDKEQGFVNKENPNYRKLNKIIRDKVHFYEGIELDCEEDFTLGMLMEIVANENYACDFYEFMDTQMYKRQVSDSTIGIHKRALALLKAYKDSCIITDLTTEFIDGFHRFLKEVRKMADQTIRSMMKCVKVFYNLARKLYGNKVPANAFDHIHCKKADTLIYHLKPISNTDVRMMENYIVRPDSKPKYVNTIEKFLFMTYTGCRISDMNSLTEDNISVENGKMWLTYTSVKTNAYVRVPLSSIFDGRAEQLINKHKGDLRSFFNTLSDCSFNSRLVSAVKAVGVDKHITAHCARHTFATRLVNADVPITTIQKLIGHASTEMTMVYAKTNEDTICRQLEK